MPLCPRDRRNNVPNPDFGVRFNCAHTRFCRAWPSTLYFAVRGTGCAMPSTVRKDRSAGLSNAKLDAPQGRKVAAWITGEADDEFRRGPTSPENRGGYEAYGVTGLAPPRLGRRRGAMVAQAWLRNRSYLRLVLGGQPFLARQASAGLGRLEMPGARRQRHSRHGWPAEMLPA